MTTSTPAIAVIDGNLCRLSRHGAIVATHGPLSTAILEFRVGPMRVYVREHPLGLLPGLPNVYCLDGDFRLQWLAAWPFIDDPCARLIDDTEQALIVETASGLVVHLDIANGAVLQTGHRMAAAG